MSEHHSLRQSTRILGEPVQRTCVGTLLELGRRLQFSLHGVWRELSSSWRMSATAPLSGDKPTLGELPEIDAHDPKATWASTIHGPGNMRRYLPKAHSASQDGPTKLHSTVLWLPLVGCRMLDLETRYSLDSVKPGGA
jgi:hypothetical protein